jgi:uncharacterized protein DUF4118
MLRIILAVLCLTIGLPVLAATDGTTLLSDADSSRVISSLLQPSTLFLFLCATVVAAWFGGAGSGLMAAVLSVLALDYFFLPPIQSLSLLLDWLPRIERQPRLFGGHALIWKTRCGILRNSTPRCKSKTPNGSEQKKELVKPNASFRLR